MTTSPPSSCPLPGPQGGGGGCPWASTTRQDRGVLPPHPRTRESSDFWQGHADGVTAAPHGPVQGRDAHRDINPRSAPSSPHGRNVSSRTRDGRRGTGGLAVGGQPSPAVSTRGRSGANRQAWAPLPDRPPPLPHQGDTVPTPPPIVTCLQPGPGTLAGGGGAGAGQRCPTGVLVPSSQAALVRRPLDASSSPRVGATGHRASSVFGIPNTRVCTRSHT